MKTVRCTLSTVLCLTVLCFLSGCGDTPPNISDSYNVSNTTNTSTNTTTDTTTDTTTTTTTNSNNPVNITVSEKQRTEDSVQ